eukprot:Rmarinus@m.5170
MVCVKDVPAHDFIVEYAQHLKRTGKVTVPEWANLVKTAHFKELAPYEPDWFYIRCASVARHIYLRGGTGVGALRKVFGGANRTGTCPSHFTTASGAVIRRALHELEKIKCVEQDPKGGRRITQAGQRDLDRIAATIYAPQENLL